MIVTTPLYMLCMDLMGNRLPGPAVVPGEAPMYWVQE